MLRSIVSITKTRENPDFKEIEKAVRRGKRFVKGCPPNNVFIVQAIISDIGDSLS
jgi:hypothetical protein